MSKAKKATRELKMLRAQYSHTNTQGSGADVIAFIDDGPPNVKGRKVRILLTESEVKALLDAFKEGYEIGEHLVKSKEETREKHRRNLERNGRKY